MRAVFLVLAFLVITSIASAQQQEMMIKAYYSGSLKQLDSIDVTKLTHIIFCFGHLSGSRLKIDDANDTLMIRKMVGLKSKNPKLKVILSLGGWGGCETCSDAFQTAGQRKEFARSVKELNDYFHSDGIDLDWEYPTVRLDNDIDQNPVHKTSPNDKENFTDLVRQLQNELGKNATITFAAGGFQTYLEKAIDWKAVMDVADYVNIMSYDLVNGYATVTGHHAALYSTPQQNESADNAVQYLLKLGIDSRKIIVGSAMYARVWQDVDSVQHGLYRPGKFSAFIPYRYFPTRLSKEQGYEYYWDDTAKAPFMYNLKEKKFATFDDKRSMELKTKYVKQHKLGGIMFWELSHDVRENGLLDTIYKTKMSK